MLLQKYGYFHLFTSIHTRVHVYKIAGHEDIFKQTKYYALVS